MHTHLPRQILTQSSVCLIISMDTLLAPTRSSLPEARYRSRLCVRLACMVLDRACSRPTTTGREACRGSSGQGSQVWAAGSREKRVNPWSDSQAA